MNGPRSTTEDLRAGGQVRKPVAEFWYAIQPQDDDIIRFSEIYVDPYAVGDLWLVRGSERDLVVDTGSGIVPPAPVVEASLENPCSLWRSTVTTITRADGIVLPSGPAIAWTLLR